MDILIECIIIFLVIFNFDDPLIKTRKVKAKTTQKICLKLTSAINYKNQMVEIGVF